MNNKLITLEFIWSTYDMALVEVRNARIHLFVECSLLLNYSLAMPYNYIWSIAVGSVGLILLTHFSPVILSFDANKS